MRPIFAEFKCLTLVFCLIAQVFHSPSSRCESESQRGKILIHFIWNYRSNFDVWKKFSQNSVDSSKSVMYQFARKILDIVFDEIFSYPPAILDCLNCEKTEKIIIFLSLAFWWWFHVIQRRLHKIADAKRFSCFCKVSHHRVTATLFEIQSVEKCGMWKNLTRNFSGWKNWINHQSISSQIEYG